MTGFEKSWSIYGKRFGSKIARANQKEGDRVGAGPSRKTGCGGQRPTWRPQVHMRRRYGASLGGPRDGRGQTIVFMFVPCINDN